MPLVTSAPLTVKMKGLALAAESPERVNVLLLGMVAEFNAIFAGLKEHEPALQERRTVSVKSKLLGAERDTLKVVVVVPMGTDSDVVEEFRKKLASAVPDKGRLEEPLVELSVTIRLPFRVPLLGTLVGVNVMKNWQLPPTAMVKGYEGHELVSAKFVEVVMLVTVKEVWPLFVMVTVCVALVVASVVVGNTRLLGENCT